MACRRQYMWKLLYNLVNRNDSNVINMFKFVNEIICNEPSLICSYTANNEADRFQLNFLLWLINKFVKCMTVPSSDSLRYMNIEMQQNILVSCLLNHPKLYGILLENYVNALEQLATSLSDLELDDDHGNNDDYDMDEDTNNIELHIFITDNNLLREIDPECNFVSKVSIKLDNADQFIHDFIVVLKYLLPISFVFHPGLFSRSLSSALQAFREANVSAKLCCLRYCHDIVVISLEAAATSNHPIERCNEVSLVLKAITIMWKSVPVWMQAGCMNRMLLEDFLKETCSWMETIRSINLDLLQSNQLHFDLCCDIMLHIMEYKSIPDNWWHALIDALSKYYASRNKSIKITAQHMAMFLKLTRMQKSFLQLLAAFYIRNQSVEILQLIYDDIKHILDQKSHTIEEYKDLETLLKAFKYIEFHVCQQQQIAYLLQNPEPTLASFYEQDFCVYDMLQVAKNPPNWNKLIMEYMNKSTSVIQSSELQEITSLLLQIKSIRRNLNSQTQQFLVSQFEAPLRKGILKKTNQNNHHNTSDDEVVPQEFLHSLQLLFSIMLDLPLPSSSPETKLQKLFTDLWNVIILRSKNNDDLLCNMFAKYIPHLYVAGYLKPQQIQSLIMINNINLSIFDAGLRVLLCGRDISYTHLFKCYTNTDMEDNCIVFKCSQCTEMADALKTPASFSCYLLNSNAIYIPWPNDIKNQQIPILPMKLYDIISSIVVDHGDFDFALRHLQLTKLRPSLCLAELQKVQSFSSSKDFKNLNLLLPVFVSEDSSSFLQQLSEILLKRIVDLLSKPLEEQDKASQREMLKLLVYCAYTGIEEKWLFLFFKMTFYFLIHPHSLVTQEAILCATEMCDKHGVVPISLWNSYKRDALTLVVQLALHIYLTRGVRLTRSLRAFTKMLGFSCVQEFICKYHRLLTTIILPYCIKDPRCKGAIVLISKLTRKSIATLFIVSFLRIYTHIYLTESPEIGNKCIELIVSCTSSSFEKLMNTDVKQTVSEILIYFNRNPTFVMRSFKCLLLDKNEMKLQNAPVTNSDFSKFIASRFLGVITHFESCLSEPNFEKPLKEEALYSLGQILRFVGSSNVTQFRFKIIAMLSFVSSLGDPNLQRIALKIWKIFLNTVNVQELGSSLSCIAAQLQPLLQYSETEVNAIYEFVILKNASMLGGYLSDLYFLEREPSITPAIRQCISEKTEMLRSEKSSLNDKLGFLYKQITNENLQVRVYGLTYLTDFFGANRMEINRVVLNEVLPDSLIERTVNVLIDGCQHMNQNLRLASAKCLGELGAIDTSYMPSNYNFNKTTELPLSILTDDFAIMALNELCRAYQFQKDTKYVDNFSLAIQETLAVCGISPKQNKKLALWNVMPERMRQIMEPLLNSCYTGSRRESKCKAHPLFSSSYCKTYSDWAFLWASRLIDIVHTTDTKHLLTSYKPSIKRDNNTMTIFFPYILLHALQECNEAEGKLIYEEFLNVLNLCSASDDEQQTSDSISKEKKSSRPRKFKEFPSKKYTAHYLPPPLPVSNNSKDEGMTESSEGLINQVRTATKLCSEQIDFLRRWMREYQRNKSGSLLNGKLGENYERIERFVGQFDKLLISRANYNCGEYARALMYMEEYIECQPRERLVNEFSFLINIYGRLMDTDSVEGAVHVRTYNLSIEQEVLVNRLADRQQDMITCYEQLLCTNDHIQPEHMRGMIDSYLLMDTPKTALLITDGLWQRMADQYTDDYFKECKAELLWRLGNYDELEELYENFTSNNNTITWPAQCAKACLNFRNLNLNVDQFSEQLNNIRCNLLNDMHTCSSVKQHLYAHSYDEVLKLHLLNEMEKYKILLDKVCHTLASVSSHEGNHMACVNEMQQFFVEWNARLEVMQPSVRALDPLFGFRRNLLLESKHLMRQSHREHSGSITMLEQLNTLIDTEMSRLWLASAQINRDAENLQRAQLSIMKAAQYAPKTLFLEKAKLLWKKGDQTIALKLLEENLEMILTQSTCDGNIRKLPNPERALYGEAKFLQATFNADSVNICTEINILYFKDAIIASTDSEKCYVHLAQYLEKIYESFSGSQQNEEAGRSWLIQIMIQYAKSLRCGCENVYQSLPRLVSIWLDTTSQCLSETQRLSTDVNSNAKIKSLQDYARRMNDVISNCCNSLPTAIFYTAFSQLLSRICHPSVDVFNILRTIIIMLIEHYPQQSLWMLLPIFKSSFTNRVKRCKLIFTDSRLDKPQFKKLLNDFNTLTERLIELTNKEVTLDRSYDLPSLVKQLPLLFKNSDFSQILLPFEKYMQPSFSISSTASSIVNAFKSTGEQTSTSVPTASSSSSSSSVPTNLFPYKQIYICGFRDEITILRSAARPKKITIRCSDGHDYDVMVKPKDDLRRDCRLMEFNGLVKRYLHQDLKARHRRLHIRTYAAIPFNEECGLVEWIPKLNSFRGICMKLYRARGQGIPDRELRAFTVSVSESIEKKRNIFTNKLLAKHPPVFQDWFRDRFHTPHTWYEARSAYLKTVAVMSIVGYILGLGDRHGENILFDECNGDAVHVDFNCLFNRGELFTYPEVVPFRLTQNMVAAMGPLGVEGIYRKCCEITLRILKSEAKTLMSVLRPFVYDLVGQIRSSSTKSSTAEHTDPKATADVKRIADRLQGYVKKNQSYGIPLSIEGQVNFLIAEATNIDNLAAMYIGWGAYV